ncbi:MAG: hypothetical protein WAN35_14480 [Terracidiphilus sp.]
MKQIPGKDAFFVRLLVGVISLAFLLSVRGVDAQPTQADPACPGLKLDIGVPDDLVRPQSEIPLEMKLTNVSHEGIWLSSGSPNFWSYDFDLRDAQGTLVPRTAEWIRAVSQRPSNVTLSVSMPLAAGESQTGIGMLDQFFDLSKPGEYALRVSFGSYSCGNKVSPVTSNLIHFTVGAPSNQPSTLQAGISVTVSAVHPHLPIGWAEPLDIVVQNSSSHPLRWAVDDPPNIAPDEFLTGVEVFDRTGKICPLTKQLDPNWGFSRYWGLSRFRGTVSTLNIPPGKSAEQIILVGDVFDISKPGKYQAKIALLDPISNRSIESIPVSFEIEDTAASRSLPKPPPFLVTLQQGHFSVDPSGVLICMSNISDHDIRMDNSSGKDFVSVEAPDGNSATLTEAAQMARKLVDLTQQTTGLFQCCTWDTVKPRKALCGGYTIGAEYNLSKAGAYRARVDRYDEPDATPGQKLRELPIVHSNWMTIFENSPVVPAK